MAQEKLLPQVAAHDLFGQFRFIKTDDGEIYFAVVDVCKVLGIKNVTQAVKRLKENERAMFYIGRQGKANFVNEPGLYRLIFSSNKPEAEKFQDWVYHEVLPSIRKTGSYSIANKKPKEIPAVTDPFAKKVIQIMEKNPDVDFEVKGIHLDYNSEGKPITIYRIGVKK